MQNIEPIEEYKKKLKAGAGAGASTSTPPAPEESVEDTDTDEDDFSLDDTDDTDGMEDTDNVEDEDDADGDIDMEEADDAAALPPTTTPNASGSSIGGFSTTPSSVPPASISSFGGFTGSASTGERPYMVTSNLKKIVDQATQLLSMIQAEGNLEQWAADHITTSADDVEEVYNYYKYK